MDLIAKNQKESVTDVKMVRETILQFIKTQLRRVEGGEASNVKTLHLFISCTEEEKHVYEAALYYHEPGKFKTESVQKIADDFAIDLPENWSLEISFTELPPSPSMKISPLDAALVIETKSSPVQKSVTAYIAVLNGEAEQDVYTIPSEKGKVNIGADPKVQGDDGFFRINHIAFPTSSSNPSNRFISRQHAHIQFQNETGQFLIFADDGGVPPRNKVKVRSTDDSVAVKLLSTQTGRILKDGDQIMLGESAILEFSTKQPS